MVCAGSTNIIKSSTKLMDMFIPGWIISILTFPGVITHELGHKLFCDIFKVKVHEVSYFRFGNPAGYVMHDMPAKFHQTFFIDVGPFIVNTILAITMFSIAILFKPFEFVQPLFVWLGFSMAMNSFPSSHDAKVLWNESKKHLGQGDLTAIIGFPFSIVIWISNLLSVIWFDLFYGLGLYALVSSLL